MRAFYYITSTKNTKCFNEGTINVGLNEIFEKTLWKTQILQLHLHRQ